MWFPVGWSEEDIEDSPLPSIASGVMRTRSLYGRFPGEDGLPAQRRRDHIAGFSLPASPALSEGGRSVLGAGRRTGQDLRSAAETGASRPEAFLPAARPSSE